MTRLTPVVLALGLVLTSAACADEAESTDRSAIEIVDPVIGETAAGRNAALYFSLVQRGGSDQLLNIVTARTDRVSVMGPSIDMGTDSETSGFPIDIDPGSTIKFLPGGNHVMLEHVTEELTDGDTVTLTFTFERHAPITIVADVIPPAELVELIDPKGTP